MTISQPKACGEIAGLETLSSEAVCGMVISLTDMSVIDMSDMNRMGGVVLHNQNVHVMHTNHGMNPWTYPSDGT